LLLLETARLAAGRRVFGPVERDYARTLGVIEALTAVRDQCPHAAVRDHAAAALEAVARGGADSLREQASLVLSTLAGWRGERADQVKRSLRGFLEASALPPR
jgi:hypothetical protein